MSRTYRITGPWVWVRPSLGWLGYSWWCRGKTLFLLLCFTYCLPVSLFMMLIMPLCQLFYLQSHSYIWLYLTQPFTNDFPHADINELISPDLLHQVIKGTFKDHLVTWVEEYLVLTHGHKQADEILDDIDRRLVIYILKNFVTSDWFSLGLLLLLHSLD